jgi:hypothetical protein
MNAPVFVTAQEQAVIAEPAVVIDGGLGKRLSLDDRLSPTSAQNSFNNSLNLRYENPCIENVSVCH